MEIWLVQLLTSANPISNIEGSMQVEIYNYLSKISDSGTQNRIKTKVRPHTVSCLLEFYTCKIFEMYSTVPEVTSKRRLNTTIGDDNTSMSHTAKPYQYCHPTEPGCQKHKTQKRDSTEKDRLHIKRRRRWLKINRQNDQKRRTVVITSEIAVTFKMLVMEKPGKTCTYWSFESRKDNRRKPCSSECWPVRWDQAHTSSDAACHGLLWRGRMTLSPLEIPPKPGTTTVPCI